MVGRITPVWCAKMIGWLTAKAAEGGAHSRTLSRDRIIASTGNFALRRQRHCPRSATFRSHQRTTGVADSIGLRAPDADAA